MKKTSFSSFCHPVWDIYNLHYLNCWCKSCLSTPAILGGLPMSRIYAVISGLNWYDSLLLLNPSAPNLHPDWTRFIQSLHPVQTRWSQFKPV